MRGFRCLILAAVAILILTGGAATAENVAGPQGAEEGPQRRQAWLLPLPDQTMLMRATVLRPPGAGPFPLAVINHGSTQNSQRRANMRMPEYRVAAEWFLARGYAVALPQRLGHGETGGPYLEDQGRCDSVDYRKAGLATAAAIGAAIDHLKTQLFVAKSGTVVIGQSAGGWGALALASRNPPISAVINFAGGRGGRVDGRASNNCAPHRLIATSGDFGRSARISTLWLYAENDTHFAPKLSKLMYQAFRMAGGRGDYHLLPAVGQDGHRMIKSAEARVLWGPIVERFLAAQE
jgi:dienelactone hydrolase